jgi:hypothetical protein
MKRLSSIFAVTGFALIVAVSGQAGAAGATTPAQKHPDQETYVRRADKVCRATIRKVDLLVEELGFSPTDRQARRAVRRIVRLSRTELDELRTLTPPKGDAHEVAAVYDAVDTGLDRIQEKPRRLFDEPGPLARAKKLAKTYGFQDCGRG